jgi:hypothetical protein
MSDSNPSELANTSNVSPYHKRTRSAIACNTCRRLKMKVRTFFFSFCFLVCNLTPHASVTQCANVNRERCERCNEKDIVCEYSACTNTQSTDMSPPPSSPTSIRPSARVRYPRELHGPFAKRFLHRRVTRARTPMSLGTQPPPGAASKCLWYVESHRITGCMCYAGATIQKAMAASCLRHRSGHYPET